MPTGVYFRTEKHRKKISNTMKGKKPSNFESLQLKSPFIKGHSQLNTGKTHFKKGFIPWNKGIKFFQISGKNHWAWKGGTYEKDRKIDMQRKSYRDWRKAIFERDNFECIWCGSIENLNADHIKPYSLFPELKYELSNGRTLCINCHKTTNTYGQKVKLLRREDYASC